MPNAVHSMTMRNNALEYVILAAVFALTTACADPAAIEDYTIVGRWSFVRGFCPEPGSTFTHATPGYAYSVDFSADGGVLVFQGDSAVAGMRFTLRRERRAMLAPPNSLVLRFSSNHLLSESAF